MTIRGVTATDERTYYLVAENERGQLRAAVKLVVEDPISMGAVIGIALSVLVLAVAFMLCLACSRRRRSCCFRDRGHFRPEDIVRIERRQETTSSEGSSSEERPVKRPDSPLQPRPDLGTDVHLYMKTSTCLNRRAVEQNRKTGIVDVLVLKLLGSAVKQERKTRGSCRTGYETGRALEEDRKNEELRNKIGKEEELWRIKEK